MNLDDQLEQLPVARRSRDSLDGWPTWRARARQRRRRLRTEAQRRRWLAVHPEPPLSANDRARQLDLERRQGSRRRWSR